KLAALGYTHVLERGARAVHSTEAAPAERQGLRVVREFADSRVLAVVATTPPVFTVEFVAFTGRRSDGRETWRAITQDGAGRIANPTSRPVMAMLEAELMAIPGPQRLDTEIDGRPGLHLLIPVGHHRCRIGPLSLSPGDSVLVFRTRPATLPDAAA